MLQHGEFRSSQKKYQSASADFIQQTNINSKHKVKN